MSVHTFQVIISTVFLAEPRESVMRIMYLISILVVLETFSLIANNSLLGAVVQLAGVLKDDT